MHLARAIEANPLASKASSVEANVFRRVTLSDALAGSVIAPI
jgi:hypothetical protein